MQPKRIFVIAFLLALYVPFSVAQIEITLKRQFVDNFADRVTIDSTFRVDITSKIHLAKDDGDIHVAGTAPENWHDRGR